MSYRDKIGPSLRVIEEAMKMSKTRPAIAFSGGKDAIVVAHLLTSFGVRAAIMDLSFYFTKQKRDALIYANEMGLEFVTPQTIFWKHLIKNEEYVFPQERKNKYLGIQQRQWKSMPKGQKAIGADLVFYGRRIGENHAPRHIIQKGPGNTVCYPIRDWTTLDVWEYMRDYELRIPWIYRTKFAQYLNNAPWITLIGSKMWCWQVVYDTEQFQVEEAARLGVRSAEEFLSLPKDSPLRYKNDFKQSWFPRPSSTMSPYDVYGIELPQDPNDGVKLYRDG